jgi:hypothetical protein
LTRAFIAPNDPRWAKALSCAPHDFYALPQYAHITETWEHGFATAFYAEEDGSVFLVPLIRRPLPRSAGHLELGTDLTSPYGYPSVVVAGDDAWLSRALEAFRATSVEEGVVTAFLRLHPLFPLSLKLLSQVGAVISHGETVYIDLTRSEEQLWSETRPRYRSYIRRLQRDGFEVSVDDWEGYDAFIAAYYQTMARLGAPHYYRFPRSYFYDLRYHLGPYLHLCQVFAPDGDLASAALFASCNGILQYHLSASIDSHQADAPSKLLIHFMRRWGQRSGHTALHLGGGVGGAEDSLFLFKSGFAHTRAGFHTVRILFDDAAYQKLTAHLKHNINALDFFPLYRDPGIVERAADSVEA